MANDNTTTPEVSAVSKARTSLLTDLFTLSGTAQVVGTYVSEHGLKMVPSKDDPDVYGCIRHLERSIEALLPKAHDNKGLQDALRNNKALFNMIAYCIGEMEDDEVSPACVAACDAFVLIVNREDEAVADQRQEVAKPTSSEE